MPSFAYTARDRSGQTVQSTIDAPTRRDAVRLLSARGLSPIKVEEGGAKKLAAEKKKNTTLGGFGSSAPTLATLTGRERLPFLQSLVDLTSSGLSAGEAIRLLSVRIKEPRLHLLCVHMWEQLGEGSTLSQAMNSLPAVFDASTINLIQAGEATGNLNDVLNRLITHLTEKKELQRQVLNALAYPVFMMFVAGGVIIFFLVFLLPKLQTLLSSLGGKLPTSTQILVALSNFGIHYGLFVAIGAVLGAVAFWRWRATDAGRMTTDAWILKLPLLGPFSVAQTVLAFSQTLSVLLENGITTSEALRMTERQITNRVHRAAFDVATARVLEGEALSSALQRTGCFPNLALDQLAVGENTGNLVPSLKKISVSYQKDISNQLNIFTRLIATVVLLGVFIFVGFIAFAIISAVFQLSSSFKS